MMLVLPALVFRTGDVFLISSLQELLLRCFFLTWAEQLSAERGRDGAARTTPTRPGQDSLGVSAHRADGSGGFSPALTCRCPSLLQTRGVCLPCPSAWSPNAAGTGAAGSPDTSRWGRAGAMGLSGCWDR